jgi:hypothetical protein
MTHQLKSIVTAVAVGLGAAATAPAFGLGSGQVVTGVRTGSFQAAPSARTMHLFEIGAAVASDPLPWLKVVDVTVGAALSQQRMQGSLGAGLSSFEGTTYGPDINVRYRTRLPLAVFGTVGYRVGRYRGHGADNWSDDDVRAAWLFREDVNSERNKSYETAGWHVGAGASWALLDNASVLAGVDLGFERMRSDARVIDGLDVYTDRSTTSFDTRSFLIGGQYSL